MSGIALASASVWVSQAYMSKQTRSHTPSPDARVTKGARADTPSVVTRGNQNPKSRIF